jgi:subtilisin-like proprotein convertase family protein
VGGGSCGDVNPDTCDDKDPCTIDSCSGGGCAHGVAPDNTVCGGAYVCSQGTCGPPPGCDHVYTAAATQIVDNACNGPSSSSIIVPDLGNALQLTVGINVANSKIGATFATLKGPTPDNTLYGLYTMTGVSTATSYVTSFPTPTVQATGPDLNGWVGKNAQGAWTLKVGDCNLTNNQKDGQFSWSITVRTACN